MKLRQMASWWVHFAYKHAINLFISRQLDWLDALQLHMYPLVAQNSPLSLLIVQILPEENRRRIVIKENRHSKVPLYKNMARLSIEQI